MVLWCCYEPLVMFAKIFLYRPSTGRIFRLTECACFMNIVRSRNSPWSLRMLARLAPLYARHNLTADVLYGIKYCPLNEEDASQIKPRHPCMRLPSVKNVFFGISRFPYHLYRYKALSVWLHVKLSCDSEMDCSCRYRSSIPTRQNLNYGASSVSVGFMEDAVPSG